MYGNIFDVCAGVPGVDPILDVVRQGLAVFDSFGKYSSRIFCLGGKNALN